MITQVNSNPGGYANEEDLVFHNLVGTDVVTMWYSAGRPSMLLV